MDFIYAVHNDDDMIYSWMFIIGCFDIFSCMRRNSFFFLGKYDARCFMFMYGYKKCLV